MKTLFLVLCLFLSGCSSIQKNFHATGPRTLVFPFGTYKHEISLKPTGQDERTFSGVVQIKEETVTVIGLSHFGSTLFRVKEDRKAAKTDVEIYYEPFKKYEDKVREFYKVIHGFIVLKPGAKEFTLNIEGKKVLIKFEDYDEHEIPGKILITHPNFSVAVKVVGYDV
jgi:hypothetical protein